MLNLESIQINTRVIFCEPFLSERAILVKQIQERVKLDLSKFVRYDTPYKILSSIGGAAPNSLNRNNYPANKLKINQPTVDF